MKKSLEKIKKDPIRPVLKALGMYKTADFHLDRTITVRTTAHLLSNGTNLYFTTRKNSETQMLEVTRIPKPKS